MTEWLDPEDPDRLYDVVRMNSKGHIYQPTERHVMHLTKAWLLNTLEDIVFAFGLTFLSVLLANGASSLNVTTAHNALVSGFVAALMVVKSLLASFVPNTVAPANFIKAPVGDGA